MSAANHIASFLYGAYCGATNPIGFLRDIVTGKYDGPPCAACGAESEQTTGCCGVPLCPLHLRAWQTDPAPCPCRRR